MSKKEFHQALKRLGYKLSVKDERTQLTLS